MSALAKTQKKKALDFCSQAEALLSKKSWFSSKERNQEDAAELLLQAANAYKVGGLSQEAGDVYVRAGELYRDSLNNASEASKSYSQAGTSAAVVVPRLTRCADEPITQPFFYFGSICSNMVLDLRRLLQESESR